MVAWCWAQAPSEREETCAKPFFLQKEVPLHFDESSVAFEDMLSANPGRETLRELLRGRGPYGGSAVSATIAACEFDRVSVLSSMVAAPCVEDLPPHHALRDGTQELVQEVLQCHCHCLEGP